MKKIVILALANIRKSKGQSISFLLILLAAALFMNLGLITMFSYSSSFERKAQEWNAPDIELSVQIDEMKFREKFLSAMREDDRIKEAETKDILLSMGEFRYGGYSNSRLAVFFDADESEGGEQFNLIEKAAKDDGSRSGIYLPYLLKMGGDYALGDEFTITLTSSKAEVKKFSFRVAGFYEDIFFSTINSTSTGFLLTHQAYEALDEELSGEARGTLFSVWSRDLSDNEGIVTEYGAALANACGTERYFDAIHYAVIQSARSITSSIGASLIVGFSLLLIGISLIVVNFRIRNSVEEEMKNIGALKALGYVSNQLIGAFFIQFISLSLAGCAAGIGLSYLVLPALETMFASQTGIRWQPGFSPAAMAVTMLVVNVLITAVTLTSAGRIKKLPPITALRTGLSTHSFFKNYFPLHKGVLPLPAAMAGKNLAQNRRQNVLISIILAAVSFASVFGMMLYYNIKVNDKAFLSMAAGESPHIQMQSLDEQGTQKLLEELRGRREVETAFLFTRDTLTCEGAYEIMTYVLDEYELIRNHNWLYQGRFPQHENEVALAGLMAKELDKEIGDTVLLSKGDLEKEYLITGLIQGSNYLGHDVCMTAEAMKRVDQNFVPRMVYVYLYDQDNITSFIKDMQKNSPNLSGAVNAQEVVKSSMASYQSLVSVLAVVINIVTAVIIGLVLYLVIKTRLLREKKEIGIKKALGYTTGQLVLQSVLAFLPVLAGGTLLGCLAGYFLLNPFLSLLFSGIGMMKVTFVMKRTLLLAVFGILVGFGFLISAAVAAKIRKFTAYTLMNDI